MRPYRPAPYFVVDIAEVHLEEHRQLQVVEFNSINSAGWYACNINEIVQSLSEFVLLHFGNAPNVP